MIGTRLAHYEITSHLGTGGMGEVYQATDSKLGRSVAIKLLPEAFAGDADRAMRFAREARVLASLNHPRIAAIYGIEEARERKFLVMELVAGDTLADRIARGPLPLDDALKAATQIAEALEAAHEKGVIHRDLKPANIKFTADGQIKVLDFGLAKALSGDAQEADAANSPTLVSMAASNGVILGTAAYMSPEQARGNAVDARTDVFAFGCVFYEMLAGKKAFAGDTVSDILAGVLRTEVDWSQLPAGLPLSVRHLLDRCLRKDRRRRLQTATDVRNEIEDILREPEEKPHAVTPAAPSWGGWVPWAAVLALAILAGVLVVPYVRSPANAPEMRLDITTASTSDPVSFAISPDGEKVVFVAAAEGQSRLWIRRLDSLTPVVLAGTEGGFFPFWSPDSKSIGFFANGRLLRLDIGAGRPQSLAPAGTPRGGTWNDDGQIVFTASSSGALVKVSASVGGDPVAVTQMGKGHSSHRFPSFLPDGRHFLFLVVGAPEVQGVYLGSLDSPDITFLTASDTSGIFKEPGYLLFVRQGTLVAQPFDVSKRKLSGDPLSVADPVGYDSAYYAGGFSVSRTGIVAYRPGSPRNQLTWFDRSGKPLSVTGAADSNGMTNPTLSPDGNRVALFRTIQGNTDIYLLDAVRMSRLTNDAGQERYPVWSRDGNRIFFDSNRKGRRNLYVAPFDRSGIDELLFETAEDKVINDVSPDGRSLLYITLTPGADLHVLPLDDKGKPGQSHSFLSTMFEERQGQFSPDGRWVVYESTESGSAYEIYIRPFPGPGGQYPLSTGGGVQPRWSFDGKEIYYVAPDGTLMAVAIRTKGTALDPGKPVALFQTRLWGGGANASTGQQYSVSRDGRFLMNVIADDAASSPITLILNWKPPAK